MSSKKIFLFVFICISALYSVFPVSISAAEHVFRARVLEITEQKDVTAENGRHYVQQNIKLVGLEGEMKDKEFFFYGIGDLEVVAQAKYKVGDKVAVVGQADADGKTVYYITDFVRTGSIYWLAVIFVLAVFILGGFKGLRALISLVLSFAVILGYIIPQILSGADPLLVGIFGTAVILLISIYLTQGFNRKAHLINLSMLISLILVAVISLIFTSVAKLSGFATEEILHLASLGQVAINLKGLLLAGILIGTLGVLDDVIVSQVSVVEQLKQADPQLKPSQIYTRALKVGVDHTSSMVNTLFFAYAGASLPLLILFNIKQEPFLTAGQVINSEMVATEIIRTLVGSIGLILAIPIATFIASRFLKIKQRRTSDM